MLLSLFFVLYVFTIVDAQPVTAPTKKPKTTSSTAGQPSTSKNVKTPRPTKEKVTKASTTKKVTPSTTNKVTPSTTNKPATTKKVTTESPEEEKKTGNNGVAPDKGSCEYTCNPCEHSLKVQFETTCVMGEPLNVPNVWDVIYDNYWGAYEGSNWYSGRKGYKSTTTMDKSGEWLRSFEIYVELVFKIDEDSACALETMIDGIDDDTNLREQLEQATGECFNNKMKAKYCDDDKCYDADEMMASSTTELLFGSDYIPQLASVTEQSSQSWTLASMASVAAVLFFISFAFGYGTHYVRMRRTEAMEVSKVFANRSLAAQHKQQSCEKRPLLPTVPEI